MRFGNAICAQNRAQRASFRHVRFVVHSLRPQLVAAEGITEREIDVLRLLAEGRTNAQIADALVLSEKTVRNHISIILDKLNVSNRVEAATYAVQHAIDRYRRAGDL